MILRFETFETVDQRSDLQVLFLASKASVGSLSSALASDQGLTMFGIFRMSKESRGRELFCWFGRLAHAIGSQSTTKFIDCLLVCALAKDSTDRKRGLT